MRLMGRGRGRSYYYVPWYLCVHLCKTREDGSHAGPCGTLSVPLGPLAGSLLSYTLKTTAESASTHTQIMLIPHFFFFFMQVGTNKVGGTARKEKLGWNGGTRGSFPSSAASLCGLQKKRKRKTHLLTRLMSVSVEADQCRQDH